MAIEKRFREMLETNIRTISSEFRNNTSSKYEELLSEADNMSNIKELKSQQKELKVREEKIQLEIREIDDNIKNARKFTHKDDVDKSIIEVYVNSPVSLISYGHYSEQEIKALEKLGKTQEYQNNKQFEYIAKDTENVFNMCATNKEARQVLLEFQSKNWRAIGVDLPSLGMYRDFNIDKSGNINTKALDSGK